MNEARIEAYLALIQALLQCENGQEPALLQANAELVDAGLVAVMKQYADFLEQQGDSNNGRWLLNMAQQLEQFLEPPRDNQDPYINFLQTLLETVEESDGNRQVIYPLLDNNLHLLDENLLNLLQAWGNQTKEQVSPEETYGLAAILYYLAYAFYGFTKGNPLINLAIAVYGYEVCATIFRQTGLERYLAQTLTGLGVAYVTQAELGQEPVANLERAIANYREALSFLNPTLLPADTLRSGRNLGNLGFQQGWWDIAIEGYSVAVEAVEQSRAWATSEALRQEIVRESIGVYENLIQAAVNQGDLSLALRTVERSRSKRLADLIAVGDLYADGRIPPEIQAWYQQVKESRQIQSQLRQNPLDQPGFPQKPQPYPIGNTRASFATEQLHAAEAAERQAWDALYRFDAITAQLQQPQPQPRLDELTALLPSPQTALLSFYTTATHTHIFVLRRPSQDGGEWVNCHTIPNPPESANDLQNWLIVNWVIPYIEINQVETAQSRQQRRDEWHQAMATRLQELATRLQFDQQFSF
jgi:tetratricopeptide (TPR) repeat protein